MLENWMRSSPDNPIQETAALVVPVFVTRTDFVALVDPSTTLPKLKVCGDTATAAPGEPVTANSCTNTSGK